MKFLEVIGEAAYRTTKEFRQQYPDIEWRRITNLRNVLVHDYVDVDIKIMWRIITADVPKLKEKVARLLSSTHST